MAKFNYEVTLPNGERYLTSTLAEAKALQARGSKYPHGKAYGKIANPQMATSRAELAQPLRQYKMPRQKWFREIVQNSADAGATNVEFLDQLSGQPLLRATDTRMQSLAAIDNGKGMTVDILLSKFMTLGATTKGIYDIGGFGEAKKLLIWPWGRWAITTKTSAGKTIQVLGVGKSFDYYENGKGPYEVWFEGEGGPNPQPRIEYGEVIRPTRGCPLPSEVYQPFAVGSSKGMQQGTAVQVWADAEALPTETDALSFLPFCNLPKVKVEYNGKSIPMNWQPPAFGGKTGIQRLKLNTPDDAQVQATLYFNPLGKGLDSTGMVLVRAGGLLMWKLDFPQGALVLDIVGNTKFLLNALRDDWREDWVWGQFITKISGMVEADPSGVGRKGKSFTYDEEFAGAISAAKAQEEDRVVNQIWNETVEKVERAKTKTDKKKREQEEAEAAKEAAEMLERQKRAELEQQEEESRRKESGEARSRVGGQTKGGLDRPQKEREEDAAESIRQKLGMATVKSTEQLLLQSATGPWAEKLKLAAWAPPIRIMNEIEDYKLDKSYLPATMSHKNLTILKVWTAMMRRLLGVIGEFNHQFGVGFVLSTQCLAATGMGKKFGTRFYVINPFVSQSETRSGELPTALVERYEPSLDPREPYTIPLDPHNPRHVDIMAGRLVHETVHGVYGVSDHYQSFAVVLTNLISVIGDKMGDIIKAGMEAAAEEKGKKAADLGGMTLSGRRTPQRVERVAGVDPRLPPVGTVLEKSGLRVLILPDGIAVLKSAHDRGYGKAKSISQAVEQHLSAVSGKPRSASGFVFFDLEPNKRSKYIKGTLSNSGISQALVDMQVGYTPLDPYLYDGWREAY